MQRNYVIDRVTRLKPGEHVDIDLHLLQDVVLLPEMARWNGFNHADWVLENICGSSYEYGYYRDQKSNVVTFYRLEKSLEGTEFFTYVSADRRHLVEQDPVTKLYKRKK